jgi:hypothetical protein
MRRSRRSFFRGLIAIPLTAATLVSLPLAVQLSSAQPASATGSSAGALEPGAGQYVPIIPVVIYGPTTLSGGATVTVPVEGANSELPTTGISAIFINIQETSPSTYGNISDCEADITPCANQPAVTWTSSEDESGSDVVTVAPPGTTDAGEINLTNNSSGTAEVAIQVGGYFTDGTNESPGSTYVPVSPTAIFDTREQGTSGHGLGLEDSFSGTSQTPDTTLPAGHTIIVPAVLLGVDDGVIASSDEGNVTAVSLEIAGINGTTSGYLTVTGGAGTCSSTGTFPNPPNTRTLSYDDSEINRITDIEVPEPSSCVNGSGETQFKGGDVTIFNGGSGTVNVTVQLHGYFISPTTTDIAGDEYEPTSGGPVPVCSTRGSGCTIPTGNSDSFDGTACVGTGGETYTGTIPSDGCVNVQVEGGSTGVPAGAAAVAAEITANYSAESGWLDIAPYEGDNGNAQVNFSQSYGGDDESFEDAVVSDTSDGAISIYNDSSGSVDVSVSVRGVWNAATAPAAPIDVGSNWDGANANVTWADSTSDGGSPVTSYTVTDATSGAFVTASSFAYTASVPASAGDSITVSAANLMGAGVASAPVVADGGTPTSVSESTITSTAATVEQQVETQASENGSLECAPAGMSSTEIGGLVFATDGEPLGGAIVDIEVTGDPTTYEALNPDTSSTAPYVAEVIADADGCWTWTSPPLSSLDEDSGALGQIPTYESDYDGFVEFLATSYGIASTSAGVQYPELGVSNLEMDYSTSSIPSSWSNNQANVVLNAYGEQGSDSTNAPTEVDDGQLSPTSVTQPSASLAFNSPVTQSFGTETYSSSDDEAPQFAPDGTDLSQVTQVEPANDQEIASLVAGVDPGSGASVPDPTMQANGMVDNESGEPENTYQRPPGDICSETPLAAVKKEDAFVPVGQWHAYTADELGGVTFAIGSSSSVNYGASVGGSTFMIGGSVTVTNNSSQTLGGQQTQSFFVEGKSELITANSEWAAGSITLAQYNSMVAQGRSLIREQGDAETLLVDYKMTEWQADWVCVTPTQLENYFGDTTHGLNKQNCAIMQSDGGGSCWIKPEKQGVAPTSPNNDIVADPTEYLTNGQPNPLYLAEDTWSAPFSDADLHSAYGVNDPVLGDGGAWMKVANNLNFVVNYPVTSTSPSNGPDISTGSSQNLSGQVSIFGFSIGGSLDFSTTTEQKTAVNYSSTYTYASEHWFWGDNGQPASAGMFYSGPNTVDP